MKNHFGPPPPPRIAMSSSSSAASARRRIAAVDGRGRSHGKNNDLRNNPLYCNSRSTGSASGHNREKDQRHNQTRIMEGPRDGFRAGGHHDPHPAEQQDTTDPQRSRPTDPRRPSWNRTTSGFVPLKKRKRFFIERQQQQENPPPPPPRTRWDDQHDRRTDISGEQHGTAAAPSPPPQNCETPDHNATTLSQSTQQGVNAVPVMRIQGNPAWVMGNSPPHPQTAAAAASSPVACRPSPREEEEDDDEGGEAGKAVAVVSDAQVPDLFETSTTSSSSFLSLDNHHHHHHPGSTAAVASTAHHRHGPAAGTTALPDIPRHIETPTPSNSMLLHPELEEKIPRKKSKLSVDNKTPSSANQEELLCTAKEESTAPPPPSMPLIEKSNETSPPKLKIHIPRSREIQKERHEPETPDRMENVNILRMNDDDSKPDAKATAATSTDTASHKLVDHSESPSVLQEAPAKLDDSVTSSLDNMRIPKKKKNKKRIIIADEDDSPTAPASNELQTASLTASSSSSSPKKLSPAALRRKKNYRRVQIGSRVSVYWDGELTYFDATVTKERPHKKKRFFLEYDDGDREWVNLRKEKWRLLSGGKDIVEDDPAELVSSSAPRDDPTRRTVAEAKSSSQGITENPAWKRAAPKTDISSREEKLLARASGVVESSDVLQALSPEEPGARDHASPVRKCEENLSSRNKMADGVSKNSKTKQRSDVATSSASTPNRDAKSAVTPGVAELPSATKKKKKSKKKASRALDWIHDDEWVTRAAKKSESDSETDDEEVMQFARQMLGVEKADIPRPKKTKKKNKPQTVGKPEERTEMILEPLAEPAFRWDELEMADIHIPISEKVKFGRRRIRGDALDNTELVRLKKKKRRKISVDSKEAPPASKMAESTDEPVVADCAGKLAVQLDMSETQDQAASWDEVARRRKEEARTLTAEEIRTILGEDEDPCGGTSSNWVRRSARMPSRSVINHPRFQQLIFKLKANDPDMVVLKMKKYLGDPDCPQVCIDTVLDALEENTNCQSLYIQNFNEGMRDKQVLRLLEILKRPSCNIWCLNIGETYKVKTRTWKAFTRGLKDTKITHMYASEHTITPELKERIRSTIRENRKKHNMHIDPENLDVIVKCTHCWWNPVNAKVLRPHLHRKGYAHILNDEEAQGLRGTQSAASLK